MRSLCNRAFLILLPVSALASSLQAEPRKVTFFTGASDVVAVRQAAEQLPPGAGIDVEAVTDDAAESGAAADVLASLDIGVIDIMHAQPLGWLLENRNRINPAARIYIVRSGARLQQCLEAGFVSDPAVKSYFDYTTAENLSNLVLFLAARHFGSRLAPAAPVEPPENGLYHPDAPRFFRDLDGYLAWYRSSSRYKPDALWDLTVVFPNFTIDGKRAGVDALVRAYEKQGINTAVWMREMKGWTETMARLLAAEPLASKLGSITGYTFRFSQGLSPALIDSLRKANVPVINAQYLFFGTGAEWRESTRGISPQELTHQFGNPELAGLIEPSVVAVQEPGPAGDGADSRRYEAVRENVELLARRTARWHSLRRKPNREKKIVLVYYNHGAGKQNIGASYLNVPRSISGIIARLKQEGYHIEGDFTESEITDLLIKAGRNIGSWAPGELDRLLSEGKATLVDMEDYERWFEKTPASFREGVEKDWGKPRKAQIMVKDGQFVIPTISLGNLVLVPQPVRGWGDDPSKLYHSTVLHPHHQYNAFYLWLQNVYRPDAMISLGTHGTHEWLPGKQAGLSWDDSPEVLIGDIPSVYPYIVDDVGEGLQAKRRGRAAVVDHATPPLMRAGQGGEYAELAALVNEHAAAPSPEIRAARFARIRQIVSRLGLEKDLGVKTLTPDSLEKLEHYLIELKEQLMPYGLHTFGASPSGEGLEATATAVAAKGGVDIDLIRRRLAACGPAEMDSLIRGLSAGYISPGSGNDPVRNPESLPTGRNFYGFDPDKVPSKEAWSRGQKAAEEMIARYKEKHEGKFPEKVGLVLWSVETIRDEGINVATALALMGISPVWDQRDKIHDIAPVPGGQLGRPRIDVLLQMSGLFRDAFPQTALLLDKAVKKAAILDDVENFLRKNSEAIEKSLRAEGKTPEEAKRLSLVRLYSAPPGAYGTKIDDFASDSGQWTSDATVAEYGFIRVQSHGYSADNWGESMTPVYRQHLQKVDATIKTVSSNLYGTMDNDDVFQYLGGLSMAVRKESGRDPEVFISMQRTSGEARVESAATVVGRELRSRYLNPAWIEGMKKENYAGAREMADFVENMWGWQVTVLETVAKANWDQVLEVYVDDKNGLGIKEFMEKQSPWAYQGITARMLEANRKGYWKASEQARRKVAAEYAQSVASSGAACASHICDNPALNEMVLNLVSIPGVLPPSVREGFRKSLEQATGKPLEAQKEAHFHALASLEGVAPVPGASAPAQRTAVSPAKKVPAPGNPGTSTKGEKSLAEKIQGFRMEKVEVAKSRSRTSTQPVQWFAPVFVFLLAGLFVAGTRGKGPAWPVP